MKKVLVVDDEKLIVKGLKFSLEQDDMEVDTAYDGGEAIEKIKANDYDIVLLDIMIPVYTGIEVCQMVREFSNVPIIMLTAKGEDMDKIMGLEYGADDYITKPFSVRELMARVKANLKKAIKNLVKNVSTYLNIYGNKESSESKSYTVESFINKDADSSALILENNNMESIIIGEGEKIIKQYPNKGVTLNVNNKVFLLTNDNKIRRKYDKKMGIL